MLPAEVPNVRGVSAGLEDAGAAGGWGARQGMEVYLPSLVGVGDESREFLPEKVSLKLRPKVY